MSALTQRWREGFDKQWVPTYEQFAREEVGRRRERIEVEDTGVINTLVTINHGLGTLPQGVVIINQCTTAATGPVAWYRKTTDPDWTTTQISMRFNLGNARVLLEVF
jgi:hypothetical protein